MPGERLEEPNTDQEIKQVAESDQVEKLIWVLGFLLYLPCYNTKEYKPPVSMKDSQGG